MRRALLASWCLASALTSCAVYVPTVPSTPLLRAKGEAEITGAIRGLSSFEVGAAYVPAPGLLLVAETALQTSKGSETRNNITTNYRNLHQQANLGLGTYRLLGETQSVYLGVLGGVGIAKADIYDPNIGIILFSGPLVRYQADYLRYYGQLYLAKQGPWVSYGFSARATLVDYRKLTREGVPVTPLNTCFLEPTWFVRIGQGPLQALGTIGYSVPTRYDSTNPDRQNLAPYSALISLGIVVRPQLFRRPAPVVP